MFSRATGIGRRNFETSLFNPIHTPGGGGGGILPARILDVFIKQVKVTKLGDFSYNLSENNLVE